MAGRRVVDDGTASVYWKQSKEALVEQTRSSDWLPGSWQSAGESADQASPAASEPDAVGAESADGTASPPMPDAASPASGEQHDTQVLAGSTDTAVLADPADTAWPPPAATWPPPATDEPQPQPPAQPTAPAAPRTGRLLAGAAMVALLAGTAGGVVGYQIADDGSGIAIATAPEGGNQASPPADGSIAAIAAAVTPAVVNIDTGSGSGSGFVITSDGFIVTNNHVIEGANTIRVNFSDGSVADAELVGANADYDLAVLNVDRTGLPIVALGSSDAVLVGDTAIAVGSPLGLSGTVTSGIISALDRPVTAGGADDTSFINAIQTDAAINPGNSGGPLLNADGEVVGVNSAIATLGGALGGQTGSIGLGFAIPIDTTKRIADEIIATGTAQTPGIGVSIENGENGARVVEVVPGGPAAEAGIQEGDVITEVDGQPVGDTTELIVAIRDNAVGDTVTLTIERSGREQEVDVVLGSL
jgi:putative serine protease PepD